MVHEKAVYLQRKVMTTNEFTLNLLTILKQMRMKKFFTLIAMALVAVGVNAQTVINLASLQTSDFTYDENQYVESTWTDSQDPLNTAPAFTKKGTNKLEALTLTGKNVAFWYKSGSDKANFFILCNEYFTVGGKGAQLIVSGAKAGQTITLNVAAKADYSGTDTPAFGATNATLQGDAPKLQTKNEFVDLVFEVSADGDVKITESAKGYNIKSITIADGIADPTKPVVSYLDGATWTLSMREGTSNNNIATYADGYKLELIGKNDKDYSAAKTLTIEGNTLTSFKLSNGAQNMITLPEGKVATKVTFYSYVNKPKANNGETVNYWQEVAGVQYSEDEATKMAVFTDTDNYQQNPDVISFDLDKVASFTFTNKGTQPCVVIAVTAVAGTPSAIQSVKTLKTSNNAAVYNLAGQKVSNNFKGIAIQNGRKVVIK